MRLKIVAVGKLKERFWKEAVAEYVKRMGGYAKTEVVEVADRDPARVGGEQKAREQEGQDILRAVGDDYLVLLDIQGRMFSSEELAERIRELMVAGTSSIAFVVGGSTGVSDEVKRRANENVSFGRITMPHNLARVVLVEQIYRSFKIMKNEPYHK